MAYKTDEDPPLIKAFLKEECYVIDLPNKPSHLRREMIAWCLEHFGDEGKDWQLITIQDNIVLAIFMNHDDGVLFELTWC